VTHVNADQSFNFLPVPTDIHFGFGMLKTLPQRIQALGGTKALVVTDPGVRAAGIVDRVIEVLSASPLGCVVYDRVTADSGVRLITEAAQIMKSEKADVVVGIGGGSSLDTSKAVAALATNPGSILDYAGLHKVKNRPIPIVAIPTTAGTGSEVTLWSVFTDEERALKVAVGSILIYPTVALCDPELTLELPQALTASTGMDALAHAVECYTNNACQPLSAAFALRAIELIGRHLRSAVLNGRNREARYAMMLASTMAGMAMNPTRLGIAHALAMPLGSWGLAVPHGVAIATMLPLVMEFNHAAAPDRYAAIAEALGERVKRMSVLEAAASAAAAVRKLGNAIGIPSTLGGYGLKDENVAAVTEEAMKSGNVAVNPRRTRKEDLAEILRRAL
jgi:alcohol dehydrogenase